jgi:uncharacterized protein (TIGR00730 family)
MRRVCVFSGSSVGAREAYAEAARALGTALVGRGLGLVFGGGRVGLMGVLADAVLAAGGEVIGVIPRALATREIAYYGLDDLRVVDSMHERKALMAELADAFVALPGGIGTFEELFEILTWAQLGLHQKPVGLVNVDGYFEPLLLLFERAITERFVRPSHRALLVSADAADDLLDRLRAHVPPAAERKWIDLDET